MRILVLLLVSFLTFSTTAQADSLKIMSWNIANLAAQNGTQIREGSHQRSEEDFVKISSIITATDADVIALQEVGSIAAAQRILGDGYIIIMEDRCSNGCLVDQGDIFTAIAYRKNLGVTEIQPEQLTELAIPHQSECTNREPRKVRGGVGLSFIYENAPYVILSVHLKASCADENAHDPVDRPDIQDDCQTLDQQMVILSDWMRKQTQNGITVIAAGDYNRKFLEANDRHANFLRIADPNIRFEPSEQSMCWPKNYPESFSFRRRKAFNAYGEIDIGNDQNALWTPYMPSSIGSRDFFVISGPNTHNIGNGEEILLRPEPVIHDTTTTLSRVQWQAVEKQAAGAGVRFGPPSGYISDCDEPIEGMGPKPKPFKGGRTVLTFQNIYPSDHCPIQIELN